MLCPEIYNFPHPKVISSSKKHESREAAMKTIEMNNFYRSLIVTCPDEIHIPSAIEEVLTEDTEYYKVTNCQLTEFINVDFIENFVKKGKLYCMGVVRNCIVENCAAVTPDGILTLHILDFIYQQLGMEGVKRPHNFYEVRIDLNNLKHSAKVASSLSKLESFFVSDFFVSWEPINEDICPSSIAKYFHSNNISVTLHNIKIEHISPSINEIPALEDVELDEVSEWIGMLAHNGDLNPTEGYISSYSQPESENALKSSRITLLLAKGFITPAVIDRLSCKVEGHVASRETLPTTKGQLVYFGKTRRMVGENRHHRLDTTKGKLNVVARCSAVLQGSYKLSGQVLILPVQGEGRHTIKIDDMVIKAFTDLTTVTGADGEQHWHINKWRHSFDVKTGTTFNFENLFNGNKVLADPVHSFVNANWREVMSEIAPPIVRAIVQRVVEVVDGFFAAVPADQLYIA